MSAQSQTKQEVKQTAQEAASSASDMAREATETAKAHATAKTEEARDGLASEMQGTAEALRKAAEEVRNGSPQGSAFSYLADGLADMADSVKDQSANDMVGAVSDFARRNPLAFLGGAALLGFTVSRFAKASDQGRYASDGAPQPTRPSAHVTPYNPNMPQMDFSND
jgi:ElaB/YqjD/DUF883 family membrane-anchored ribosome-binding protein